MPKISILTPTVRKDGLEIIAKQLAKQTFKDFEWLVGSSFDPKQKTARWIKDDFSGGFWSLNRIYNKMFKKARGKYIVSLQDHIWIPPDALGRLLDTIEGLVGREKTSKVIVSGVGDQYDRLDQYGKPEINIWSDPRKTIEHGSLYECYPNDAEWNWCIFPKDLIFEIGGMDEQLDFMGYGGDQFQVGQRWDDVGVKFFLDQSNESFTKRHDRSDFGGEKK